MSDVSHGPGWWLASDGRWYPPEASPGPSPTPGPIINPVEPPFPGGVPSAWSSPATPVPAHILPSPVPTPTPTPTPGLPAPQLGGYVAPAPFSTAAPVVFEPVHKRRRIPPVVAWIAAGVLLVTTVVFGVIALQQSSSAKQWRKADETALAELAVAHASIKSLDSEVSTLNGHVSTLNTQLSAEASAKEKALDQNTILSQIVNEEGSVSTELNTCVTDLQTFISTVGTDLGDGNYNDPYLSSDESTASSDCNQAQSDNQAMQSALSGAGG